MFSKIRKEVDMKMLVCFLFALLFINGIDVHAVGRSQSGVTAIKKYDPVAYFKVGEAVKGNEDFSFEWNDKIWHFSSKENRDLFATNPEKYAPQYDGYCAWAMTEARKAETDPQVWKIVDEKLYLNCSREAYEKWKKDIPGNIKKADKNWMQKF